MDEGSRRHGRLRGSLRDVRRTGSRRRGRRTDLLGPGHGDLISALPDDLLLQVLGRLPCAAAARTSVLAGRWRGLWTRLPTLTFRDVALGPLRCALASLGAAAVGPGVSFLDIAFNSVKVAAGVSALDSVVPRHELQERMVDSLPWLLRAAAGLSPAEFHLALLLGLDPADVELPRFHRATSIQLCARSLRLMPPRSGDGFPKLETLSLSGCRVDLAALVLNCPCLRVLRVTDASLGDINIQSESLQKLFLRTNENHRRTDFINVEAPMLKQLTLFFSTGTGAKLSVSVVAPILEKVSWGCSYDTKSAGIAPWGLSKLRLYSAESLVGQRVITGEDTACFQLSNVHVLSLQMSCDGRFHPQLDFLQQIEKHLVTEFSVLDLTMVYNNAWGSPAHFFGPLVLHLLGMHRIGAATRRLQIHILRPEVKEECSADCFCNEPKNWRNENISLINLEEVEIKSFVGEDHEIDFLRVIFRCAPMLKTVSMRVSDEATTCNDRCTKIHEVFKEYPFVECNVDLSCDKNVLVLVS